MPNDDSRPERGQIPQAWQPAIVRFEGMLERDELPDLSACLKNFSGEIEPLVAELVATYQSFHAVPGNDISHALNDLIQANPRWRTPISQAIGELSAQQIARETTAPVGTVDLPRKLGRYLLVESLGKGGFSEVFLGCIPNSAEFVVIKVPRQDISRNDLAKEALRQEKNALLQLRGLPGVAKFMDWHEEDEGTLALVSEFEQARPLDHVCESEEHSTTRVIAWMTALCEIVQAAHKAGVHHCDLKPQNVLVAENSDQPILIDFGLAQTLLRWSREAAAPAAPAGTLHYLAPELLDESHEAVPRLVDMFGLGALLYYLMTGSAPFRAIDQASARKRVANCNIDFTMLDNAPYAEELKAICRRAMAKVPRERYQSPQALLSALRSVPLSKPPQAPVVRKVPTKKTSAMVLAGSLLVFGGLFFSQSEWGDRWRSDVASRPSMDQVESSFHDRSPSPAISEVENPTPGEQEDEQLAAKQEVEEVPTDNEPSQEEQAIAQRPASQAVKHKVAKIPLPDVNTVPSIAPRDITVSLVSARRDMKPWGSSEEDFRGKGKLIICLDNRIETLAAPLHFRFDSNLWRPLKQSHNLYSAILEPKELDHGDRLEIAVGDAETGFLAGPFSYRRDYPLALAKDDAQFIDQLVEEARSANCFVPANQWVLSKEFSKRYAPIIKEFRFCASRTTPITYLSIDEIRPSVSPTEESEYFSRTFRQLITAGHNTNEMWTEIDFINGSFTGERLHQLHNPQLDRKYRQEAVKARQLLAGLKDNELGQLQGFSFVPLALAKADLALAKVEMGETKEHLSISAPVVTHSVGWQFERALFRMPPTYVSNPSMLNPNMLKRHGTRIAAIHTYNPKFPAHIPLPPLWAGVYFRGVFKDGSSTDTYFVENQAVPPGFELECVEAEGCEKTKAYAYVFFNKTSVPERSVVRHLNIKRPSTLTEEQMANLHRIRLSVYAESPRGATWFEHFGEPELIHSRAEITPGLNYTLFLDRYSRKVGVCTYRVDVEAVRRAVVELIENANAQRAASKVND